MKKKKKFWIFWHFQDFELVLLMTGPLAGSSIFCCLSNCRRFFVSDKWPADHRKNIYKVFKGKEVSQLSKEVKPSQVHHTNLCGKRLCVALSIGRGLICYLHQPYMIYMCDEMA